MTPTTQAIIKTWASSCTTEPEWDSWKRAIVECRLGYIDGRDLPVTRIRRWSEEDNLNIIGEGKPLPLLDPYAIAIRQYQWGGPYYLIGTLGIVATYLTPEVNNLANVIGCDPAEAAVTVLGARDVTIPSATEHAAIDVPEACITESCIVALRGLSGLRWSIPALAALRDTGVAEIDNPTWQRALCLAVHATDPTVLKHERMRDDDALHRIVVDLTEQSLTEDTDITTARALALDVVRSFRTQAYDIDWELYWK